MTWAAVALTLAVVLCMAGVAVLAAQPASHSARAVVAISPRDKQVVPSAAMIRLLAAKYVSYASSDAVFAQTARELEIDPQVLRRGVEVSMPEGGTIVNVAVETRDRATSISVAGELSRALTDWSERDPTLRAETVVEADSAPVGFPRILAIWVLLVGALMSGVALLWLRLFYLRGRRSPASDTGAS